MANITFGGLVTGIDTSSIVTQLMNLERAPERLLQAQQKKNTEKINAYQKIEDALTSLQSLVKGFNTAGTFSSLKTTVANTSVLTATADSGAMPGTHTVQVVSLAKSQRQVTTGVASSTDLLFGTGTFTIDGGAPITIAAGQNSLKGIADAINASGAKVNASIINDGTNYRMVINGTDTVNHNFDFSGLGAAPVLLGAGDPTYQDAAQAQLVVDGVTITKPTNTVTDAIQGVTLNLMTEGASTTISAAIDTEAVTKKINDFVAAYNNVNTLISAQLKYDTNTKTAGTLSGDSALRSIQSQLRSLLTTSVSGATGSYSTLAQIGIKSDSKTGALSVESAKLSKVLSEDYANVVDYFTHNGSSLNSSLPRNQYGIAQQFSLVIDTMVKPYVAGTTSGLLESRKNWLTTANSRIDDQIDAMELRFEKMETSLLNQYNRMETTVSRLQTQGNMLLNSLGLMTTSSSSSSK